MTRELVPQPVTLSAAVAGGIADNIGPESRQVRAVIMLQEVNDRGQITGTRISGLSATQVFSSRALHEIPPEHHEERIRDLAGAALHDLLRQLDQAELVGVFIQAVRKDGGFKV